MKHNMKIIISHDVDHLYMNDHIFNDLIIPKLWIRSFFHFIQGKLSFSTFYHRLLYIFDKRQNRISEVMYLDKKNHIPSTFFFGMNQGLGMSYKKEKAIKYINYLVKQQVDVGVHGIAYEEYEEMLKEYKAFQTIIKRDSFGIRTHYVRYNQKTFEKFSQCGYIFDSSEFNKKEVELKEPYKVGNMWEFPLHIMDGYIIPVGNIEQAKRNTKKVIRLAEQKNLPYCTILFHDYQYNEKCYPQEKEWYDWLVCYLIKEGFEFISYHDAIRELEEK